MEKSEHHREKLEERLVRLEQEIIDYEKHIEHLNEERSQEENLEEKNYIIEEKLRKSEKRNAEMENLLNDIRKEYEDSSVKFTAQDEENKNLLDELKALKLRAKDISLELK